MTAEERGLSPHVRGNRMPNDSRIKRHRSIPACTGKPRRRRARHGGRAVYPRMYGETLPAAPSRRSRDGLSPHVRGNLVRIAAAVGRSAGVYPRMYGETVHSLGVTTVVLGLSPHVRGNPADTSR